MRPESKWLVLPSVRVFDDVEPSKAQVVKIAEETCEVYSAWENWWNEQPGDDGDELTELLVDECADLIQAACNLLAALGITDLTEAMAACRKRNADRGRITK